MTAKNDIIIMDESHPITLTKTAAKPAVDPRVLSKMDAAQKQEILKGIDAGVDVSVYANPDLTSRQMEHVRMGLEYGVNMMPYIGGEFDDEQIIQIGKGMIDGVDFSVYAKPNLTGEQMKALRLGLNAGIDVSPYANGEYDDRQIRWILQGISEGLDVSIYDDNTRFNADQMFEIYNGLHFDLDVSLYADPAFTARQMKQILSGISHREDGKDINVELYAKPEYSNFLMEAILTLSLTSPDKDPSSMLEIWGDHPVFNDEMMSTMNEGQREALVQGFGAGIDVTLYADSGYHASKMKAILSGLKEGFDVTPYVSPRTPLSEIEKKVKELKGESLVEYEIVEMAKELPIDEWEIVEYLGVESAYDASVEVQAIINGYVVSAVGSAETGPSIIGGNLTEIDHESIEIIRGPGG